MLEIKLLGELQLSLNGEDLTSSISSKCAALIALLMAHKNHRMSREELLGYLWPESSEDAAKYNLRYNLWQLKKALGEEQCH